MVVCAFIAEIFATSCVRVRAWMCTAQQGTCISRRPVRITRCTCGAYENTGNRRCRLHSQRSALAILLEVMPFSPTCVIASFSPLTFKYTCDCY